MISQLESAKERVLFEGENTRKAITDAVEQLHRHIEEGKKKLMTTVDQNIEEKLKALEEHCEKTLALKTQMRNSESIVQDRLKKMKDSIEITAETDELMQIVSEVRLNYESIKFTVPNTISFSSNSIVLALK